MLPPFFQEKLKELRKIEGAGLLRSLKLVESPHLNFCSNNYLGLANDPRLIRAGALALRQYGAGSGAARLISGNSPLSEKLELQLARFKGTEAALLFNSGYHANIGVIPALTGQGDLVLSDELNHASLIDGCRLAKAKTIIYRHNDLNHLETLLKRTPLPLRERVPRRMTGRVRAIVTEAVFSMEGDLCPLDELLKLADRYGAIVYLDEAHAVGVFGKGGEGLAPRPPPPHLITMGTLGKAFGSYGAFVAGSHVLKKYLINRARSFIFTTALPPAVIGASLAALKIVRTEPERRRRLWDNINFLGSALGKEKPPSPIFSLLTGSAKRTMEISDRLLKKGIHLQGIRPPSVPEGKSRLRLTVTTTHTERQILRLVRELKGVHF